jgi:hypothetical protein
MTEVSEPVTQPVATPKEEKPARTFTEEEVNTIVKERLERDRKTHDYGTLKAAAEELAKLKQTQMSDAEKKDALLKEMELKVSALETEKLAISRQANQLLAASQVSGFPTGKADRLKGDTVEEMIKDAQSFLADLKFVIPGGAPVQAPTWDDAIKERMDAKDVRGSILLKLQKK